MICLWQFNGCTIAQSIVIVQWMIILCSFVAMNYSLLSSILDTRLWWCCDLEMLCTLIAFCKQSTPVTGGFPSPRASNVELWCILKAYPEKMKNNQFASNQDTMMLKWHHCKIWIWVYTIAANYVIQKNNLFVIFIKIYWQLTIV